jgi:hypothetical protein
METSSICSLNVGGTIFEALESTLKGASFFETVFSGKFAVVRDESNRIFIDRSPRMFGAILQYLRNFTISSFSNNFPEEELVDEAEFYGVSGMVSALREQILKKKEKEIPSLKRSNEGCYVCNSHNGGFQSLAFGKAQIVISKSSDNNLLAFLKADRWIDKGGKLDFANFVAKQIKRGAFQLEENQVIFYSFLFLFSELNLVSCLADAHHSVLCRWQKE